MQKLQTKERQRTIFLVRMKTFKDLSDIEEGLYSHILRDVQCKSQVFDVTGYGVSYFDIFFVTQQLNNEVIELGLIL